MHENAPTLKVETRERIGSRYAQRVRKNGKLPAILYGHGEQPLPIALDAKDTITHINKGEKVFRLAFNGQGEGQTVLLKDLQFDYLGTNIVHADFVRVDLNERVRATVAIHLIGDAKGLKTAGAILTHPVNEIEIECRVVDLPESIDVSVVDLDVGGAIHAGDIKLPTADMKLITDPKAIVAHIEVTKEQAAGEAATVAGAPAAPEVITAKKPAEGQGGAAKPDAGKKK